MATRRRQPDPKEDEGFHKATSVAAVKKRIVPVKGLLGKVTALVYGRSGTGKTTFAATIDKVDPVVPGADRVLILDISEEGTDSVYDQPTLDVIELRNWNDFAGVYQFLKKGEHKYKAVIIDTITQLQRLAMDEAKLRADVDVDGAMTRRAWGFLSSMINPMLLSYRDLPMHVILIAQDRKDETEDEEDDLIPDVGPAVMPSIATTVNAMVKVIGQTYITQKEKNVKGQIRRTTTYRLRVGPHPFYLTKLRCPKKFKVTGSIPNPNFSTIVEIIRGDHGKKSTK